MGLAASSTRAIRHFANRKQESHSGGLITSRTGTTQHCTMSDGEVVPFPEDAEPRPRAVRDDREFAVEPIREDSPAIQKLSVTQESFAGPLPHPSILEGYDKVIPGAAERILAMAEREQAHRHKMDSDHLSLLARERSRGQTYGFAIGCVAIVAGALTATLGHPIAGSLIGGGGVAGLVAVFVIGKHIEARQADVDGDEE